MSQQGSGASNESHFSLVLLGIIFFVVILATLPFWIETMLTVWRYLRIVEFWALSWIPSWVPLFGPLPIAEARDCLMAGNESGCFGPEGLGLHHAEWIDRTITSKFSWIPGIIFIVIGIRHMAKQQNVSQVHDMETILKFTAPLYPHIQPYTNRSPVSEQLRHDRNDPDTAPSGTAMSPEDFARLSPPLGLESAAKKNSAFRKPIWDGDLGFDTDLAERAFVLQLGRRFESVDRLDSIETKIYKMLLSRLTFSTQTVLPLILSAVTDGKEGGRAEDFTLPAEAKSIAAVRAMISEKRYRKATRDIKLARAVAAEKSLDSVLKEMVAERVMARHAFVVTGLMSLLEEARLGGVLAGSELLWIKAESRRLWYSLDSAGRKTPWVEGAGPYAHWLIERHLGRPITHPLVGEAVTGLYGELKLDLRRELAEEEQ